MRVIMKKPVLTKKFNYRKLMSLGAIPICTMALAGCSPTSNKDTNHHITKTEHIKKHKNIKKTTHHITKTEHVKKHKNVKKTTASSSPSSLSSSLSKASSAATSSRKPAVTHSTTVAASTTPAKNTDTTRAPAQTTSGFNVNGHHFDIGSFSGTGLVPTDKVYQWSSLSGWYLIDINSVAARYTSSLGVGSPVTVNGHTYHVTQVLYNQPNNGATLSTVKSMLGSNAIGWQTCNSERYLSNLNLWFAN